MAEGLWIESHVSLRDHPKVLLVAQRLNIKPVTVVGHLSYLWWWAIVNAPDGDLTRFTDETIARVAGWSSGAGDFIDALIQSGVGGSGYGFIDRDDAGTRLHDWDDYAGRLLIRRQADAERKRHEREAKKAQNGRVRQSSAGRPQDSPPDRPRVVRT